MFALEKTGMIDRHYIDIMHQIRKLGNRGAHVGETPVDEGKIKMQIEPLNDLIDFYNSFD